MDTVLQLPRQRELPRQPKETTAQILARGGTLVCLSQFDGRVCALVAMAYTADL